MDQITLQQSSLVSYLDHANRPGRLGTQKPIGPSNARLDCHYVLTKIFGHSGYKGKQKEVFEAAVSGNDVFVVAPTGMGKSLCFQVPALADKHGVTVVVSPLLALMKNQVENLRQKGISVVALTSETSRTERQEITDDLSSGHPRNRLLYITPEKLCTSEFLKLLDKVYTRGKLNRLIVDEAHCISEWGHDFRAQYRRLGMFRDRFGDVPIMALTATATSGVQLDIIRSLRMSEKNLYRALHPFNRDNLYYEVRYISMPDPLSQMADVFDYITTLYRRRKRPSSGVIYCRTRVTCDELSGYLKSKGLNVKPYHRGIKPLTLDKTLKDWTIGGSGEGGVDLVVATVAFGLGIDKSDVRYIIHYDLPRSFEGYYQETGRAGRDGSPAKCIMYYSREDAIRVRKWVTSAHDARRAADLDGPPPSQRANDSLSSLFEFAESTDVCRHVAICRYFGEVIDTNDANVLRKYCNLMCDICKYPDKTKRRSLTLSSSEHASSYVTTASHRGTGNDHDGNTDVPQAIFTRVTLQPPIEWQTKVWQSDAHNTSHSSRISDRILVRSKRHSNLADPSACAATKRSASGSNPDSSKKAKVAYAPALITRPFDSAASLRRPFKTPFKIPLPPSPPQEPSTLSDEIAIIKESDHPPEHEARHLTGSRTPPLVEDIAVELGVSFSNKIPMKTRLSAFNDVRRALYSVFMVGPNRHRAWESLEGAPRGAAARDNVITAIAREIELSGLSLCSTAEGYKERVNESIEVVGGALIRTADTPDDQRDEDVEEILDLMKRVCKRWGKGKEEIG